MLHVLLFLSPFRNPNARTRATFDGMYFLRFVHHLTRAFFAASPVEARDLVFRACSTRALAF